MHASCLFAAVAILIVRESRCVPRFPAPDTNQLLGGVTDTAGGIVPDGGKLNDLSAPTIAAPVAGLVPGATHTVKNLMDGVLGDGVLGKRDPAASPPTIPELQDPQQGLSGVESTLHQTGSSVLDPVTSQSLPGVGKVPSLLSVGSVPPLPAVGTLPSVPASGALPSVPAVGSLPSVLGVGALPSVPAVGSLPSVPAVGSIPSVPDVGALPSVPAVGALPKAPAVGSVASGLPLGAVPGVPKILSGVTNDLK